MKNGPDSVELSGPFCLLRCVSSMTILVFVSCRSLRPEITNRLPVITAMIKQIQAFFTFLFIDICVRLWYYLLYKILCSCVRRCGLRIRLSLNRGWWFADMKDLLRDLELHVPCFAGKSVLCMFDRFDSLPVWNYLHERFADFNLKSLCSVWYGKQGGAIKITYYGGNDDNFFAGELQSLNIDRQFRRQELQALVMQSDLIIAMPPKKYLQDYVRFLDENQKQYFATSLGFEGLWFRNV